MKLKSNWMNQNTNAVTFRAASKGKVFTRQERIAIINAQKAKLERMQKRLETILIERNKAKEEAAKRNSIFKGVAVRLESPASTIRKGKDGLFIQPRLKGAFLPKINL